MRHLIVDVLAPRRFRVRGTEAWALEPADPWLCAHDILHHLPTDSGHVHEEAMTFGAELWMEYATAGLNAISWDNLAGVLSDGYRCSADLAKFVLPDVPLAFRRPALSYVERFQAVVELGLADFLDTIQDRHIEAHGTEIPQDRVDAIGCEPNQARMTDWMSFGYRVAQRRFPDPDRAAAMFRELAGRLARHKGQQPLELMLDERNYQFA